MEDGVAQAASPTKAGETQSETSEDDFDPWALPELKDHGPKWEGEQ